MRRLRPLSPKEELRIRPGVQWGAWVVRRRWGKFRVTLSDRCVRVDKLTRWGQPDEWSVTFTPVRLTYDDYNWSESGMSKWIKKAVGAKSKAKPGSLPAEAQLCEGRPALTEFLTETEGPSGGVREPSVLMVCLTDEGVRLGLKDEDCGGWCWRVGKTLQLALDAVEKALTGDEPAFRQGRQQQPKKRR